MFFGFKVVQGHRFWYPRKARQQCLLWYAASLSIARFQGGTQIWCARMEDSLNLGGQSLHHWNLRLMPNISYAGCPSPSMFKVIQVIDVGSPGKIVSSACYDKQQVCVYLQQSTVAEIARFQGGTPIWCARTENSLNLERQTLHRWNLRLMPNISYAGCPGLFWMVSAQFILKMCIAA